MPSRRVYLTAALTSLAGGLAGCTGESDPLHKVEMDNNVGEDIEAAVDVTSGEGESLFSHTFQMAAGNMDEGADPFDGDPTRISVTVDDGPTLTADWPTLVTEVRADERPETHGKSTCMQGGQDPTGVFIRLEAPAHARLEPTCGTFRQ